MKKKAFAIFAIATLVTSASVWAEKVTTTVTVPGTAKSVTTTTPPGGGTHTVVDCDAPGQCCYTQTTTTESQSQQLNPGDKVEISGVTDQNEFFDIVGGYINISEQQNADGTTKYFYILSENWNQ